MATLRIFWPEDIQPPAVTKQMPTLSEFYESYVLPIVRLPKGRSPGTIMQDRVALSHWKRATGDPPMNEITPETCAQFIAGLIGTMAPTTIRKTAIHLQFMLDCAGPPDRRHRSAAGLLESVPYIERPEAVAREPDSCFTMAEIERLIESTRRARPIKAITFPDPCLWWASLIRFAWHTGLRLGNILNARWSWIDADGWMRVPQTEYKQHKPGRRFYLSAAAREAAARVRTGDLLFAFGARANYFHARWRTFLRVLPLGRRFHFKGFRRATLTWLAERNPIVSRLVAGHRKLDILEDFYCQRSVVVDVLESMPIPAGWDLS